MVTSSSMKSPVFIVGCPRSGTSFLYHMLLSSGGFAAYHTQMNVFDVLEPIYGDLAVTKNLEAATEEWLRSKGFTVSGLNATDIKAKLLAGCRSAADFIRIIMEEVARKQGVDRWADSTPTNVPHMLRIKHDFPDAQFVHIIRDARDVALSLDKRGWTRPLPWDKKWSMAVAGVYWEWIVRKARKMGAQLGPSDYCEVHYEDLVEKPVEALPRLSRFLQHELDYDRIQESSVGSVKRPLTAFKGELQNGSFAPVGRWKRDFPREQLVLLENLSGKYLREMGYELATKPSFTPIAAAMRAEYLAFYAFKQWAKVNTPLSRMTVSYSGILIDK